MITSTGPQSLTSLFERISTLLGGGSNAAGVSGGTEHYSVSQRGALVRDIKVRMKQVTNQATDSSKAHKLLSFLAERRLGPN
jgi:hypothetical protein